MEDKIPAIGKPNRHEIVKARIEILRDNQIISYKSGSKDKINLNESDNIPIYFCSQCFPIITAAAGKIHVT